MDKLYYKNKIDIFITDYCKDHYFSGSLKITIKNQTIYQKSVGFADFENKIPFNDDSLFTLYSLSKPFCTLGLFKLVDKGLIDINAHPSKYLPQASGFDKNLKIHHLLRHISGLPDFEQTEEFKNKYAPANTCDLRKHVELISNYPMRFSPGQSSMYANVNFIFCALIIENVSGQKYSDYMKKEVFLPLEMKTAYVDDRDIVAKNKVKGYSVDKSGNFTPVEKSYNWLLGAGDIVGTVNDVYCLNKAIKNRLLLSEESWQEILTPSPLNSMGMGCSVYNWHNKYRISHNGGHYGFRTLHIQLPNDDFDLILLSNCDADSRTAISEGIHDIFYGKDDKVSIFEMDKGYI